ncbi:MAG TPA: tyrosine--tRNA ligase [Candidatus Coatesbacteria bacterium]|nr:tyrosine--tRNA ligase [Candidatus Coatesbacteria bacterium]
MSEIKQELERILFGLVDCITAEELEKRLAKRRAEGQPLRLKLGADPSAPDIHLGHSVPLRKLRQMQQMGHHVDFVIGDFTGMIGDPTGRSKTRPALTREEVAANARTYEEQVFKILLPELTTIRFNSEWSDRLNFSDVIRLAAKYTVAGMLERNDYRQRFNDGQPVGVHEFLYPLAQAYDSVVLATDIEIGGTDQLFNFICTRDIMGRSGVEPEIVITVPLLEGTDGVEKMSKSLDNYIGISEPPEEMYGKTMSIPDGLIVKYFTLTTDVEPAEVRRMEREMASGAMNPRDAKARLARELVALYHGADAAKKAEGHFETVFRQKKHPPEVKEYNIPDGMLWICAVMVHVGFAKSNSEARRLMRQGAVKLDHKPVKDENFEFDPEADNGIVLQVGKLRFATLIFNPFQKTHGPRPQ